MLSSKGFRCDCRVKQAPQSLDELGESIVLWEKLNNEQSSIELRILPLTDQFAILDKYEVPVPDQIRNRLHDLPARWHEFQLSLVEADAMLKKSKVGGGVAISISEHLSQKIHITGAVFTEQCSRPHSLVAVYR